MPTKRAVYEIADYKAVGAAGSGEFTALVSVFGNVDLVGDRVMPGAFGKSLARWKTSGDPIPVIWSHSWDDPFAHIGYVTSAVETAAGLQITGKNDVAKPFAAQVHDLLTARRVKGMSFAYDVISEKTGKDGANELDELDLIEVGPTLKGANPDAQLVSAKALLEEAAEKAKGEPIQFGSLSGRKVYLDADLPGTFEETRDAICVAARALLNPSADPDTYVYVEATFPTYAIVEVHRYGGTGEDETFQIAWSADADGVVTLGELVAVELQVTVTPKSAGRKAGRRISKTTETELNAIHDHISTGLERMKSLIGTATEDDGKNATADAPAREAERQIEDATKSDTDHEPPGRSLDAETLRLRSRIAEMRATQKDPSVNSS